VIFTVAHLPPALQRPAGCRAEREIVKKNMSVGIFMSVQKNLAL
jgi:hypothetical protein